LLCTKFVQYEVSSTGSQEDEGIGRFHIWFGNLFEISSRAHTNGISPSPLINQKLLAATMVKLVFISQRVLKSFRAACAAGIGEPLDTSAKVAPVTKEQHFCNTSEEQKINN
jgi:hypothetical protein